MASIKEWVKLTFLFVFIVGFDIKLLFSSNFDIEGNVLFLNRLKLNEVDLKN